MVIAVVQLGTVDYATGLRLQSELVAARKEDRIPDTLLLLEHKPVITLGRNGREQNILQSREQLASRGVELFETDRGGDVTFHGPGQLVGYPIFDLRGFPSNGKSLKHLGAVDYVRRVEEVLIRGCLEYGIPTKRVPGLTGVWTDWQTSPVEGDRHPLREDSKIAAIGVHISRSVTSHGFALNVNTDLDYFKLIVPCGIADKPVTSLAKELDRPVDVVEVAQCVSRNFGRVFDRQMMAVETVDELLGRAVGVANRVPDKIKSLRGETDSVA